MGSRWKHFKVVMKHKAIVFRECRACGLFWRGLVHDLSKLSPIEFGPSARYFQGNRSPIDAEKEAVGYSAAWLHHKGHNPHHWEYWTDFDKHDGHVIPIKMPYKYVVEMMCDFIGAGIAYNGDKWTQSTPLEYWCKVRNGRHFHQDTEALALKFLACINEHGLEEFHKMARCKGPYKGLQADYEGWYSFD